MCCNVRREEYPIVRGDDSSESEPSPETHSQSRGVPSTRGEPSSEDVDSSQGPSSRDVPLSNQQNDRSLQREVRSQFMLSLLGLVQPRSYILHNSPSHQSHESSESNDSTTESVLNEDESSRTEDEDLNMQDNPQENFLLEEDSRVFYSDYVNRDSDMEVEE